MDGKNLVWEKRLFSLFIFLLLVAAVLVSSGWELRASLIVLVLGGVGVVLALAQVVLEFRSARRLQGTPTGFSFETPQLEATGRWGNLEVWGWILGFFAAIHLIGFLAAVPLFVMAYSKSYGASWPTSMGLSLLCWGFVYGLFEQVLHAPWPRALLFSLF